MIVLALDTAASFCAVCVYDAGSERELSRHVLELGKGHAEHVIEVIGEALRRANLSYRDIDRIAVSIGPGTFTGVRVGVSAARGLALALGIPAIGVTTLDALALEARERFPGKSVLCILGRRQPYSFALYDGEGKTPDGPQAGNEDELSRLIRKCQPILCGEAAAILGERNGMVVPIEPAATADIATYARLAAKQPDRGEKPVPFYSRPSDAAPATGFAVALKE